MNVWQAVAAALAAEKTPIVFGIPGGDRFFNSIRDNADIGKVLVRDPRAAPFMAMGYARVSGKPAVCYSVAGPGVALLVPGILEAHAACQPVIAIVSSSKRGNARAGGSAGVRPGRGHAPDHEVGRAGYRTGSHLVGHPEGLLG